MWELHGSIFDDYDDMEQYVRDNYDELINGEYDSMEANIEIYIDENADEI